MVGPMTEPVVTPFAPPQTIYAVALLYQKGKIFAVFSRMLIVSGDDPLLPTECRDRADAELSRIWNEEDYGPREQWELACGHLSWVVQK